MHVFILSVLFCLLASVEVALPPKAQAEVDAANRVVMTAKQNLVKKLEPILAETTKKGDLEGAMAIKKYMDSIKDDIKAQTDDLLGIAVKLDGTWKTSHVYVGTVKDGKIFYNRSMGEATVVGTKVTFDFKTTWGGVITFDVKGAGPYQCTENGIVNHFTIERVKD